MPLSNNKEAREKQLANLKIRHVRSVADRFWEKVDKNGECWIWNGALNYQGYGVIWIDQKKRSVTAHRVAWFLEHKEWPVQHVLHHCDTPRCVRYAHFFAGTNVENGNDRRLKGRACRGEKRPCAKLTSNAVGNIRREYKLGIRQVDLARKYAVSQSAISLALLHKSWKHVA